MNCQRSCQACGRVSCASQENCLALSVSVIKEMQMLQIIISEVTHFPVNMSRNNVGAIYVQQHATNHTSNMFVFMLTCRAADR